MAFIRARSNGKLSLVFWWKGRQHIKALRTTDLTEAEDIRKDAEQQLQRIRSGKSPTAARLLKEGFSISDVLFGSPEVATRIGKTDDDNPLTLAELAGEYVAYLEPNVGFDQKYNSELRFKRLKEFFGDDHRVTSLSGQDLEKYRAKRMDADSVGTTSVKKELVTLKSAIRWGVDSDLLGADPIKRWPRIKDGRQKRFEWKADIEAMIASHHFDGDEQRRAFLKEMKLRLVLTPKDIGELIQLARDKMPDLVVPLMVACATGLRRKGLVLLRKRDVDPARGTIIVGSAKQSRSEKVSYRSLALPSDVAEAVRRHHAALPPTEDMLFPVFRVKEAYRNRWVEYEKDPEGNDKLDRYGDRIVRTDRFGNPVPRKRRLPPERLVTERARRMLDRLVHKTGFELMNGWHCLRHSFISICVASGWSWQQIAEYVGHVSPETTRLYTHFNLEESRRRIESLAIRF